MGIRKEDGSIVWINTNATPIFSGAESTPSLVVVTFSDITARKRIESALRESEYWLRESQRVSRIGSYVMDVDRDTWVSSETLDEIFGIGPDYPHTTAGWGGIIHPDDRASMLEYLAHEVVGQRRTFDREYRIVRQSDGEIRWVHGRGGLFTPSSGQHLFMTGTIQDITERKQAEEALRLSEERFRHLFYGAADALFIHDREGHFVDVNQVACDSLGYSRAELLRMNVRDIETQMPDPDLNLMWERASSGANVTTEGFHRRRDGSTFPVEVHIAVLTSGERPLFMAAARDISERVHAAAALDAERTKYQSIFNMAGDAIFVREIDGSYLDVNPIACERLGYTREQMLHMTPLDITLPEQREQADALIKAMETRGHDVAEIDQVAADGHVIRVELNRRVIEYEGRPAVLTVARDLTERRRAEEALRENERRLALALKVAQLGVWEIDVANGVVHWSPECHSIFGVEDFDGTLDSVMALIHPEDLGRLRSAVQASLTDRAPAIDSEYRVVRPTGEIIWVSERMAVSYDASGKPKRLVGVIQDVTARRAGERARTLYQSLARFSRDMILYVRMADGRIVEANSAAVAAYGYSHDELLALTIFDLRPAEKGGEIVSQMQEAWEKGLLFETLHKRKDGSTFPVEVSSRGVEIDGAPLVISVIRDISERRHAEELLRTSERRLSVAISATADAIWEWNLQTGETYYSPRWYEMLGYGDRELPMSVETWRTLCHPDDLQPTMNRVQATATGPDAGGYSVEFRMRHKDGSWLWVLGRGNVVERDSMGKAVQLAGTNTDITAHRNLEDQLRHAQKMESVGRLAGGVAHDFNNLLTVINGYGDLALSRLQEGAPLFSELQQIRNAGERAKELTQQLLAFSRRQPVQLQLLDLNATVQETERMLRRVLGEDIELVCILEPALGPIQADPGQIHQVIMNLAVNARDAMPSGGKVVIETQNVDLDRRYAAEHWDVEPGSYVRLSFSDTGSGMSQNVINHAFEPFFTTKEQGKGTGLGLATVFGIVKQSGGHVSVSSEPGRGATFCVYLPRHNQPGVAARAETAGRAERGGHETILVVEDQAEVRRLTCTILRGCGYELLEAANGEEALQLLQAVPAPPVDLLLSDVVMPRMGGPELVAHVKVLRPDIRVLFVSGYVERLTRDPGCDGPPIEYLPKPFDPDSLAAKVREVLDREGQASVPPAASKTRTRT